MSRFDICLPYVLAQEGRPGTTPRMWINTDGTLNAECWSNPHNFSDDAHDPGGKTFNGIEQREFTAYLKRLTLPSRDVRTMSISEGRSCFEDYWFPHCDSFAPGMDLVFFDSDVNEGEHEATMILQHAIGAPVDGMWGNTTTRFLGRYLDQYSTQSLIAAYTARRKEVYQMMPGFQYFGKDWLRRSDEIAVAGQSMTP